jgi:hypothetical protein
LASGQRSALTARARLRRARKAGDRAGVDPFIDSVPSQDSQWRCCDAMVIIVPAGVGLPSPTAAAALRRAVFWNGAPHRRILPSRSGFCRSGARGRA